MVLRIQGSSQPPVKIHYTLDVTLRLPEGYRLMSTMDVQRYVIGFKCQSLCGHRKKLGDLWNATKVFVDIKSRIFCLIKSANLFGTHH